MNRPLLFMVVSLVVTLSCERIDPKYPEGPLISPFTSTNRVTNTWEWSYHWENGDNRSGEYADSTLILTEDNVVKICGEGDACREGAWQLISKRTRLQFIFGQEAKAYDIDMLRKNEMWLSYKNADSVNIEIWQLVGIEGE